MEKITYDGPVSIAVGSSRKSVQWENRSPLWSELVGRLGTFTQTTESRAEYKALPKPKRDEIKDVGGFVGGALKGSRRKAEAVIKRRLLTLDLDEVPADADPWSTVTLILGCAAVLYSTHSYTKEAPRLRLVMPLSRDVTPDEYTAIARRVADDIGIDMCDDSTYEPHRLMYWPSCSIDADYIYQVQDGPWLDADEQLQRYTDWHDPAEWPKSSRQASIIQRMAKKQQDPYEKPGVVGAFCRTYPIEECIEAFLPEVYSRCDDGRYTYTGGTTAGGLVIYGDGRFAYSHHSTDPCCGMLCNSFDLVRIHLYGSQDYDSAPGTPVSKLPSYVAMQKLAFDDKAVYQEMAEANLRSVRAAFSDVSDGGIFDASGEEPVGETDDEDLSWTSELELDSNAKYATTVRNVRIILTHDSHLKGRYYFDTFKERAVISADLPWQKLKERSSACWADSDDAGLHEYLETVYKIDHMPKLREGVDLAMLENSRHPVREYLQGLVWDGVERADTLFIDYLGAEDSEYTRAVTRKALIGAVARIFRPGCKHDHMLVLVGPQGCRKSSTLAKLGKSWFSDSLYTVQGKEAYEQLSGSWIVEMGEMAAARKAELEQIKQFISKQVDSYRGAYARRSQDHPRQCAFFGTTNDDAFLKDATGGRRFWPVVVGEVGYERGDLITDEVVDQVWAEIVVRFKDGENWYLTGAVENEAREIQDLHTERSAKEGLVLDFLERPVPKDWINYNLEQRLLFWAGEFAEEKNLELVPRDRVCALEIWVELFHGDVKNLSYQSARELSDILRRAPGWKTSNLLRFGSIYGRQRGFRRTV